MKQILAHYCHMYARFAVEPWKKIPTLTNFGPLTIENYFEFVKSDPTPFVYKLLEAIGHSCRINM